MDLSHNILSLLTWLPIFGGMAVLIAGDGDDSASSRAAGMRSLSLAVSLLTFVFSIFLFSNFDTTTASMQFVERAPWIEALNVEYFLGVDGISAPLILLTAFITPLVIVAGWDSIKVRPAQYFAAFLILEGLMIGVFSALDGVLFYVFWEAMLVPMFLIIGVWGGERRIYATLKFFLYTFLGSVLMLVAFIYLYNKAGSFNFFSFRDLPLSLLEQQFIFIAFLLAFAVKVPMWPFHTWLPDAHTAAPTIGSVILAAVLLKLGTYGFIRIALPILPNQAISWAPFIGVLAVIGIIYGSLACLAQTDVKRLIAYSSVGHMGFVMLGIATMTDIGINAAIIGMVAHGLITGLLFFIAGSMSHRYHTRDMGRLGGNMILMPKMGVLFGFAAMASLGLPALAGFWGEFMALMAAFSPLEAIGATPLFRGLMVVGAIGTVLTAGYMLYMLRNVNFGEPSQEWLDQDFKDVDTYEWLAWAPLVIGTIAIGIFPKIVFGATNDAVIGLVEKAFGG